VEINPSPCFNPLYFFLRNDGFLRRSQRSINYQPGNDKNYLKREKKIRGDD
jgi:hypothetical protein